MFFLISLKNQSQLIRDWKGKLQPKLSCSQWTVLLRHFSVSRVNQIHDGHAMNSPRVALPFPRFTLVGEGRTTLRLRATKLLNEDARAETLRKASIAAKAFVWTWKLGNFNPYIIYKRAKIKWKIRNLGAPVNRFPSRSKVQTAIISVNLGLKRSEIVKYVNYLSHVRQARGI